MINPVKVLVVDDSAAMRGLIRNALSADPEIEVIGEAGDALQARSAIKALNPDVITLDVEMPNMNGLEFLEKIMTLRPMPVIMVSTLTHRGAQASLDALELGAFDCIGKPSAGDSSTFDRINEVVKAAGRSKLPMVKRTPKPTTATRPVASAGFQDYSPARKIIAIGSSTGGVEALINVISKFPANCPPTVITQHMPPAFTGSFAARLDRLSAPKVKEAEDGDRLEVGKVLLAPGGTCQMEVTGKVAPLISLREGDPVSGHCPSVDVLFASVARIAKKKAVGVILTGMGRDGANGLLEMRKAGANTVGQNEKSCVVYGMPKVAFEIGAVESQHSIEDIAEQICKLTAIRRDRVA
ncbi:MULTISPECIES: protein-glutamate methylesterase/protein-glutamine glutaminase [unclassified Lentilitoribacter]|jgi:two-component system chemotaxis response regulator CheB|uniref:protein-glutamate methylesterase/protein-glutamine glutaminase n=1 Tax=unclassified Lentilitoribacter TaxID=2647570 RepID=UPI0013A6B147|nr:chemotaxis response regulator protein-glutamate methylesterase [Lentilitoribacter sp. Alg239-R112]